VRNGRPFVLNDIYPRLTLKVKRATSYILQNKNREAPTGQVSSQGLPPRSAVEWLTLAYYQIMVLGLPILLWLPF
jgi:hypothetical protein